MTACSVGGDGQLPDDDVEAVELARGLAAHGEIYFGIDVLLTAIGPGVSEGGECYRAQWGCLIDLLNKAIVHQAAEDAYEVTSFLDRFGINPEEDATSDDGVENTECAHHDEADIASDDDRPSSTRLDCDFNQQAPSIPSSSCSEGSETSVCSDANTSERLSTHPVASKRQRFRHMKYRLKCRMSEMFKPVFNSIEESFEGNSVNEEASPKRRWWQRRRKITASSNQVDHSRAHGGLSLLSDHSTRSSRGCTPYEVSESQFSCESERSRATTSFAIMGASTSVSRLALNQAESSMSSSQVSMPWAVSEYDDRGTSERSMAATSFAIMETSASVSRLAPNQVESSMSSSRGFMPWSVSEYDDRGVSERSRAATSFAIMETSTNVSRLAPSQFAEYSSRDSSGIVRFFGSFRFRATS